MKKAVIIVLGLALIGVSLAIFYFFWPPSLSYFQFKNKCEDYARNIAEVMLSQNVYIDVYTDINVKSDSEVEYRESLIMEKQDNIPCYPCIFQACNIIKTKKGECLKYGINNTYCPLAGMSYSQALKEIAKEEIKTKTNIARVKKTIWFLWLDGEVGEIKDIDISWYPPEELIENMKPHEIFKIEKLTQAITLSVSFSRTEKEVHLLEFPLSLLSRKETKITVPNEIINYSVSNATACEWSVDILTKNSLLMHSTCGFDKISVPIGRIYFR